MPEFMFTERVRGVGERLYNNPFTRTNTNGTRYRPTRMRLPSWVDRDVMTEGVDEIASTSVDVVINRISEARPLEVLLDSPLFPRISKEYRSQNLIEEFREEAPSDDVEMVDWMHRSAAEAAVLSGWAAEYNRNSLVNIDSGDPTAPHDLIGVQDFNFDPTEGRNVASSGSATFRTPDREVSIANDSGQLAFGPDNIGAGAVRARAGNYQWNGKVAQFKELAETPIEEPIRFPKLDNFNMPNVFNQAPPERSEQQKVSFNLSSAQEQDVRFAFRNPNDYTQKVTENTLTVPEGTSQVEFQISATPAVPPVLTEMEALGGGNVQSVESYSMEAQ